MAELQGKQVLLGVTGGIAAYKAAELLRLLRREGARVRVVMTAGAQAFITPLSLQALSGEPVHSELLDADAEAGMGHIELARWADLIVVAPASADFIARLAHGFADDLLTTLCLATRAPIALAPAMNQGMWANAATQSNLALLAERGLSLWGPDAGEQACGDVGPGRMWEAQALLAAVIEHFGEALLQGTRVVITAGPTREALDPVRYLSNRSSGKMGYALAQAAQQAGAETVLISGPCHLTPPPAVTLIKVTSAQEMLAASLEQAADATLFIAAAAVADYRAVQVAEHKIKKAGSDTLVLELVKNPDIVAAVAALPERPFTVGFAAETENLEAFAEKKLQDKNLDLVLANDVSQAAAGFDSDSNAITLIARGERKHFALDNKQVLARRLMAEIAARMASQTK